jgi:hypothetical protein
MNIQKKNKKKKKPEFKGSSHYIVSHEDSFSKYVWVGRHGETSSTEFSY